MCELLFLISKSLCLVSWEIDKLLSFQFENIVTSSRPMGLLKFLTYQYIYNLDSKWVFGSGRLLFYCNRKFYAIQDNYSYRDSLTQ